MPPFLLAGHGEGHQGLDGGVPRVAAVAKAGPSVQVPFQPIASSYPWEVVALDYLSLGQPADTHQNILVMTDLFSRFTVAVPTEDQMAQTTALWTGLIQPFGCLEHFLTDHGGLSSLR